jgi:hypothetical protein
VSADSIVPGAGNPQALNRYSYVFNSPLNYTDPTGHCPDAGTGPLDPCVNGGSNGRGTLGCTSCGTPSTPKTPSKPLDVAKPQTTTSQGNTPTTQTQGGADFYVPPSNGIDVPQAITRAQWNRIGTSSRVGDFRDLKSLDDTLERIPRNWTVGSQQQGRGAVFSDPARTPGRPNEVRIKPTDTQYAQGDYQANATIRIGETAPNHPWRDRYDTLYYDNRGSLVDPGLGRLANQLVHIEVPFVP